MDHLSHVLDTQDVSILNKPKQVLNVRSVVKEMLYKRFGRAKSSGAVAPIQDVIFQ